MNVHIIEIQIDIISILGIDVGMTKKKTGVYIALLEISLIKNLKKIFAKDRDPNT